MTRPRHPEMPVLASGLPTWKVCLLASPSRMSLDVVIIVHSITPRLESYLPFPISSFVQGSSMSTDHHASTQLRETERRSPDAPHSAAVRSRGISEAGPASPSLHRLQVQHSGPLAQPPSPQGSRNPEHLPVPTRQLSASQPSFSVPPSRETRQKDDRTRDLPGAWETFPSRPPIVPLPQHLPTLPEAESLRRTSLISPAATFWAGWSNPSASSSDLQQHLHVPLPSGSIQREKANADVDKRFPDGQQAVPVLRPAHLAPEALPPPIHREPTLTNLQQGSQKATPAPVEFGQVRVPTGAPNRWPATFQPTQPQASRIVNPRRRQQELPAGLRYDTTEAHSLSPPPPGSAGPSTSCKSLVYRLLACHSTIACA